MRLKMNKKKKEATNTRKTWKRRLRETGIVNEYNILKFCTVMNHLLGVKRK